MVSVCYAFLCFSLLSVAFWSVCDLLLVTLPSVPRSVMQYSGSARALWLRLNRMEAAAALVMRDLFSFMTTCSITFAVRPRPLAGNQIS